MRASRIGALSAKSGMLVLLLTAALNCTPQVPAETGDKDPYLLRIDSLQVTDASGPIQPGKTIVGGKYPGETCAVRIDLKPTVSYRNCSEVQFQVQYVEARWEYPPKLVTNLTPFTGQFALTPMIRFSPGIFWMNLIGEIPSTAYKFRYRLHANVYFLNLDLNTGQVSCGDFIATSDTPWVEFSTSPGGTSFTTPQSCP